MSLRSTHELEGIAARMIQAHGVLQSAVGDTDVEKWFKDIVRRLRAEGVAHQQWLRVALQLIHPDIKSAMKAEHGMSILACYYGNLLTNSYRRTG